MEQYISKSALVAEIERRQKIHFNDYHINGNNSPADYGACNALTQILAFIDTFEVKNVDLESEITLWANAIPEIRLDDVERLATYFFELGIKTQKGE